MSQLLEVQIEWDFELCGSNISNVDTDALIAQFKMVNPDANFYLDEFDYNQYFLQGRIDTAVESDNLNPLALLFEDENCYPFYCEIDCVILRKNSETKDLVYEINGCIDCSKLPPELLLTNTRK